MQHPDPDAAVGATVSGQDATETVEAAVQQALKKRF